MKDWENLVCDSLKHIYKKSLLFGTNGEGDDLQVLS